MNPRLPKIDASPEALGPLGNLSGSDASWTPPHPTTEHNALILVGAASSSPSPPSFRREELSAGGVQDPVWHRSYWLEPGRRRSGAGGGGAPGRGMPSFW